MRPLLLACSALLLVACATGDDGIHRRGGDGGELDSGSAQADGGGCTPACASDQVCRDGVCITPGADADGDGVPATTDCDDDDASIGSTAQRTCSGACGDGLARCTDGVWGACDAPASCDCAPGSAPRTIGCDRCGTQQQVCTDGTWTNDGVCSGMGACNAGDVEIGPTCGNCGTSRRTCNADCTWGEWVCMGEGECARGATDTRSSACGACGEGTQTDTRTCSASCRWGGWTTGSCATSATCAPGATDSETRACSGSCGMSQTRTRSCGTATCTWGTWGSWTACGSCGDVCGDSVCGATESCASCADCRYGHGGSGNGGDSCAGVPEGTWRCVYSSRLGGNVSQVCRSGGWVNFNLNPQGCSSCVCSFSTSCCQAGSSSSGC